MSEFDDTPIEQQSDMVLTQYFDALFEEELLANEAPEFETKVVGHLTVHSKLTATALVTVEKELIIPLEHVVEQEPESVAPAVEEIETEDLQQEQESIAPVVEAIETEGLQQEQATWLEDDFEGLLFQVHGLSLAVPLISLQGVTKWPSSLTVLPGYADWFLGIFNHQGRQIRVVDTARLVLPAQYRQHNEKKSYEHIILINNSPWGLACNRVDEVLKLAAGDIQWRKKKGMRPWLAGTVIDKMCALINTEVFSAMLDQDAFDD